MNSFLTIALILAVASIATAQNITILPQITQLHDELCVGSNLGEQASGNILPVHRKKVMGLVLKFQRTVVGPNAAAWVQATVRANVTLVGSILISQDGGKFLDILTYMQYGDPNPYVNAKEWVKPCKYADDLLAILKSFTDPSAAIRAQIFLLNLWIPFEKNYHQTLMDFYKKYKKPMEFALKDPGFKAFYNLIYNF